MGGGRLGVEELDESICYLSVAAPNVCGSRFFTSDEPQIGMNHHLGSSSSSLVDTRFVTRKTTANKDVSALESIEVANCYSEMAYHYGVNTVLNSSDRRIHFRLDFYKFRTTSYLRK